MVHVRISFLRERGSGLRKAHYIACRATSLLTSEVFNFKNCSFYFVPPCRRLVSRAPACGRQGSVMNARLVAFCGCLAPACRQAGSARPVSAASTAELQTCVATLAQLL